MTCEELHRYLSSYLDGCVSETLRTMCEAHLESCPVCRAEVAHMRKMMRALANLPRPSAPVELAAVINSRLQTERRALQQLERDTTPLGIIEHCTRLLAPRLMPYTIGSLASIFLFFFLLGSLRPNFFASTIIQQVSAIEGTTTTAAQTNGVEYDVTQPVSMQDYAASRTPFNDASPSLNPNGALAALVWSKERGKNSALSSAAAGDDDMVVVADVFSDGQASLAGVITPPRNRRMLGELENALRRDAAFVPASLDNRPRTMRVVFMFQKMDVRDHDYLPQSF